MSDKKLLVLDLDETLIYSTEAPLGTGQSYFRVGPFFTHKRPFLDEFIKTVNNHFDLAVWSSGSELYVKEVVENIFPKEIQLVFEWSFDRCSQWFDGDHEGIVYKKKLSKIKTHSIENILIIEDTPENCMDNYGNAIYVNHFRGDQSDTELKLLSIFLPRFEKINNVREIDKINWKGKLKDERNAAIASIVWSI